ncbi:hypothetical protein EDF46_0843 [Frondihabitans sp. PhB188]|uniref:hypothetical protein n=1 Tax=Frondihabitans sp. PhB188 TaxID=2485200 RepID=UPI000F48C6C1|nr:hypothetical protein [Frondihabitans sp. PhB188]ROQ41464.1 hypothetical protein EDF46_0843 [Frondihabitans sp. PhB188]
MSPEERRSELEARVYGAEAPDPRDVAELRALLHPLVHGRQSHESQELPAAAPAAADATPPPRSRPARSWVAGAGVAVLVAGLAGAGVAQALHADPPGDAPGAAPAAVATYGLSAVDPGAAVAQGLGSEYFDQKQVAADIPAVVPTRVDPATTRRVLAQFTDGRVKGGIWVARGIDDSFCLIMAAGSDRAASSCTPEKDAAAAGVRLDLVVSATRSYSARWNISAGILEVSPMDLTVSRTARPTPTGQPGLHPSDAATPTP